MRPLEDLKVLDFSTLLPGPMASLILAEAGADVIKIERPGRGDEMRSYVPKFGQDSVNFALLNRGKKSLALDLKDSESINQLMPLLREADVLIEQFRPGVMDRLGLGYPQLREINPGLIYCSITGYGQSGPNAAVAAHDLNYIAETGLLGLSAGADGAPIPPPALIADIGGGTYPAVMNILLALHQRDRTGEGNHLDISMSDGLFPFMYWALGEAKAHDQWPRPGNELVTGGSPRYQIYRTADDRFVAAAPLEQKFWDNFCWLIDLPEAHRSETANPKEAIAAVAERIRRRPAAYWQEKFQGVDVCCSIVATLQEALANPHFQSRRLFDRQLESDDGKQIDALPVPLAPVFRAQTGTSASYPPLGRDNDLVAKPSS
ncbi:MAG: CoA transferase [Ectothiorhodospiraceae bacterium]|nr:CoA transferase [Ectothiorhodospiraceae bacterium]